MPIFWGILSVVFAGFEFTFSTEIFAPEHIKERIDDCNRREQQEKAEKHFLEDFSNMYGAWRSSGLTHCDLIANMKRGNLFKHERVEQALRAVDRGDFVPISPYQDSPQTIGFGATISAPHMHAMCLELLVNHLQPNMKVLDVGCGSGYLSAVMGRMVAPGGKVVGIDHIQELVELSRKNTLKSNGDLMSSGVVVYKVGDGRLGDPDNGPYDCIHVGAAAAEIPRPLMEQLKPGGRLIVPVGPENGDQSLIQIDKGMDGRLLQHRLMGVRYVPLTDRKHQLSG